MKSILTKINFWLSNKVSLKIVLIAFVCIAIIGSIQVYYKSPAQPLPGKTRFENYKIFRYAHSHLLENKNLYVYYPDEHANRFKYSPTFALGFGAFSCFPDWLGILLWNLFNCCVFYLALARLPGLSLPQKIGLGAFVSFEFHVSILSQQSNPLVAGLIVLGFIFLEKDRPIWASLFIVCSGFIKIYGLLAFLLFLFYPHKHKLVLYSLFWFLFLAILPLMVIPLPELMNHWKDWGIGIQNDHDTSVGLSIYGLIHAWFGLEVNKNLVLGLGTIVLLASVLQPKKWASPLFRKLVLASILIWVIIFNHKAESPSYIIAIFGIGIWYFSSGPSRLNQYLLVFSFLLVSFLYSDFYPRMLKKEFDIFYYCLKTIPCLLVFIKLTYDLFRIKAAHSQMSQDPI